MVLEILYIIAAFVLVFGGIRYGQTTPTISPSYYSWYIALCVCVVIAGIRLFPNALSH